MHNESTPVKGEHRVLDVESLAVGGDGVARMGGRVVFVDRGLPGQRVLAEITQVKKRFARARVVEVSEESPHAVSAPCPHFGRCGGCLWQNLDYAEQLRWKQRFVAESLERIGGLGHVAVAETVASPRTLGFRNKMEFAFAPGRAKGEGLRLGLYQRGSNHVLNVERCMLLSEAAMDILAEARSFCRASKAPAWSKEYRSGFWRHLVLREAAHDGSCLAHVITAPDPGKESLVDGLARHLLERFPHVACVVHSTRRSAVAVAHGQNLESVYAGEGTDADRGCRLRERVGGLTFSLSADAFFQTNTLAAEQLYAVIRNMARQAAGEGDRLGLVWDAYCGAGGIALTLAPLADKVLGWDMDAAAVDDAAANAQANDLGNCAFVSGDAKEVLAAEAGRPDLLVLDPPRSGLHPDMADLILEKAPKAVISVSCDPATQARDLANLAQAYDVTAVTPVDLFPHSPHVESVALLIKR